MRPRARRGAVRQPGAAADNRTARCGFSARSQWSIGFLVRAAGHTLADMNEATRMIEASGLTKRFGRRRSSVRWRRCSVLARHPCVRTALATLPVLMFAATGHLDRIRASDRGCFTLSCTSCCTTRTREGYTMPPHGTG